MTFKDKSNNNNVKNVFQKIGLYCYIPRKYTDVNKNIL